MKIAKDCVKDLKITIPCLLDDMNNTVDKAYSAKPDRLAVIDINGRIAYHSARGPWGFKPKEAADALKGILENKGCNPGTEPEKFPEKKEKTKN